MDEICVHLSPFTPKTLAQNNNPDIYQETNTERERTGEEEVAGTWNHCNFGRRIRHEPTKQSAFEKDIKVKKTACKPQSI